MMQVTDPGHRVPQASDTVLNLCPVVHTKSIFSLELKTNISNLGAQDRHI